MGETTPSSQGVPSPETREGWNRGPELCVSSVVCGPPKLGPARAQPSSPAPFIALPLPSPHLPRCLHPPWSPTTHSHGHFTHTSSWQRKQQPRRLQQPLNCEGPASFCWPWAQTLEGPSAPAAPGEGGETAGPPSDPSLGGKGGSERGEWEGEVRGLGGGLLGGVPRQV